MPPNALHEEGQAIELGWIRDNADDLDAKDYLVNKRGLDRDRIVTMAGGYREQPAIESWLVPSRASLPKPTPTVKK